MQNYTHKAEGEARAEEITFLRDTCGMSDRAICERLGMRWDSYTQYRRRHPELGPVRDPESTYKKEEEGWKRISERLRGRTAGRTG